jgi:hypothetical protein
LTDITTLSKYCDTDTALKILHSQSLRWSAPHLFNDPFEPDYTLAPELDFDTVHRSLVRQVVTNMFNDNHEAPKNQLMTTVQRWREREQFTDEEEAEPIMRNLLEPLVRNQWVKLSNYYQTWSDHAKKIRIACFCSKPNIPSAWQHYGDNHQGIALEFHAGNATQLTNPLAISYDETPPALTTLREQVATMLGRSKPADKKNFQQLHLIKNKLNSSEKEWRCIKTDTENDPSDDPDTWYSYYKFPTSELKAVYFGINIDDNKRKQLFEVLKERFPLTKVYQAKRTSGKYAVEFIAWRNEA